MDPSSSPRGILHRSWRRLRPSEGMQNKVTVAFETVIEDILEDPVTGIQTLIESDPVDSLFFSIDFSIASTCPRHICDLLIDRFRIHSSRSEILATSIVAAGGLGEALALCISSDARKLGFGFEINLLLDYTEQRVVSVGLSPLLQKLVSEGTIDGEELKKLKMGKEQCSICLEGLSCGGGVPTRMPCSHVFHDRCLFEWFSCTITCPMCRRVVLAHMKQHREGQ